jgi:hypothetical protein
MKKNPKSKIRNPNPKSTIRNEKKGQIPGLPDQNVNSLKLKKNYENY